jgi:hypothetical protein
MRKPIVIEQEVSKAQKVTVKLPIGHQVFADEGYEIARYIDFIGKESNQDEHQIRGEKHYQPKRISKRLRRRSIDGMVEKARTVLDRATSFDILIGVQSTNRATSQTRIVGGISTKQLRKACIVIARHLAAFAKQVRIVVKGLVYPIVIRSLERMATGLRSSLEVKT